ncbi:MAG: flagellar hook-length control protein FliK [Roseovarius sp.]|uniref:flagellar hook-length control protein FliK n=1 Tax=Roseovarius sp. TaxID=1486281 RepID=UPI0032EB2E44
MHALVGLGEGQPPVRRAVAGQAERDRLAVDAADRERPLFESHLRDGDLDEHDVGSARTSQGKPPVLQENDDVSSVKDTVDETGVGPTSGGVDDQETGGVLRDPSAEMALTDPQEVPEERLPDGAVLSAYVGRSSVPKARLSMSGGRHESLPGINPVRLDGDAAAFDVVQGPERAVSQGTFADDVFPGRAETSLISKNPAAGAPQLATATVGQGSPAVMAAIAPVLPGARNPAPSSVLTKGQPEQSGAALAALPLVTTAPPAPDIPVAGRVTERATGDRTRAGDMTRVMPETSGGLRAVDGIKATAPALPMMPFIQEGAALRGVPQLVEDDVPAFSGPRAPAVSAQGFTLVGASALPPPPQHVIMQVAAAIGRGASGASRVIELTLNPEELGSVRLSLSQSDAGLSVSVLAERPETLDLLRRNIDLLARELLDIGYQSAEFSFGQEQPGAHQHSRAPVSSPSPLSEAEGDTAYLASTLHLGDRLDIRL